MRRIACQQTHQCSLKMQRSWEFHTLGGYKNTISLSFQPEINTPQHNTLINMPRQTKNIIVTYRGEGVNVHYWAGGSGRKVSGYLTSYRQLQSRLNKYFHVQSLDLYTLVNRKMVHITSDSRLKQALATAPSGGYLFVHAFAHHELHRTTKFIEHSPLLLTRQVERKPALPTKRQVNKTAKTAMQKRLEHRFPARGIRGWYLVQSCA